MGQKTEYLWYLRKKAKKKRLKEIVNDTKKAHWVIKEFK